MLQEQTVMGCADFLIWKTSISRSSPWRKFIINQPLCQRAHSHLLTRHSLGGNPASSMFTVLAQANPSGWCVPGLDKPLLLPQGHLIWGAYRDIDGYKVQYWVLKISFYMASRTFPQWVITALQAPFLPLVCDQLGGKNPLSLHLEHLAQQEPQARRQRPTDSIWPADVGLKGQHSDYNHSELLANIKKIRTLHIKIQIPSSSGKTGNQKSWPTLGLHSQSCSFWREAGSSSYSQATPLYELGALVEACSS